MRRLSSILLSMLFWIPMLVGTLFSTIQNSLMDINSTTESTLAPEIILGEGGNNPLIEDTPEAFPPNSKIDNSFQNNLGSSEHNTNDSKEIVEYTYKTYEDYLVDLQIPTSIKDISQTTVTGDGSENNPYQINSKEDFLFLSNIYFNNKYFIYFSMFSMIDE